MLLAGHEQEKQKIGPSGGSPSQWKYYEAVHQTLGGFKSFCPAELVEDSIMVDMDMEPIYIEADAEAESPLSSPGDGPSTSRGCARPSSSDALRKKKPTIMEEIKEDLFKATKATRIHKRFKK
ncbi:uncharacterized protein LOC125778197 [Bactrocera dorsalis]|uniref:Uncharacterized protein LOC125778197 n=1 Tax=Bactrocera dorsalis TaxID=27457 RepID=A0ABM3JND5_BACDO|nr:uncharacterized protein LOC125778197 [Bactrocera dorsalis]